MKHTLTKDDLFVVSIGDWGEGCGEKELLTTVESLNIDPKTLFDIVEKLAGTTFEIISASKCTIVFNFEKKLADWEYLPEFPDRIKAHFLEIMAEDIVIGLCQESFRRRARRLTNL